MSGRATWMRNQMFPSGAEMKMKYNDAITSMLNELIETSAKFGNMSADVTGRISHIGPDVEAILVDHGYEVRRYKDCYNVARNVIHWDNDIDVVIPKSQLVTSTKLRNSRMKEIIMESIAQDFTQPGVGTINGIPINRLCLNEYLHRNHNNPIVQDCIKTVCTYGYSYNKTTNQFTPI